MVNWNEEAVDELLTKSIGEIREMLAYEDSALSFEDFLLSNGWIEIDEDDCDNDWNEEEDEEEDDEYTELPSDQEALANQIADDILDEKYTIDAIRGMYSSEFINRVEELVEE